MECFPHAYSIITKSCYLFDHDCGGMGIGVGSLAFGLIAGKGGPFFSWKGFVGASMLCGLPYTGLAGGAMNGCASVLNTTVYVVY